MDVGGGGHFGHSANKGDDTPLVRLLLMNIKGRDCKLGRSRWISGDGWRECHRLKVHYPTNQVWIEFKVADEPLCEEERLDVNVKEKSINKSLASVWRPPSPDSESLLVCI